MDICAHLSAVLKEREATHSAARWLYRPPKKVMNELSAAYSLCTALHAESSRLYRSGHHYSSPGDWSQHRYLYRSQHSLLQSDPGKERGAAGNALHD